MTTATTRIIPMHIGKGRTAAQSFADRTGYGKNPDKTNDGELISAYACDPHATAAEFAFAWSQYERVTGRQEQSDVIAYQVRQSFKPGEVTPEEANKIGYEFAPPVPQRASCLSRLYPCGQGPHPQPHLLERRDTGQLTEVPGLPPLRYGSQEAQRPHLRGA